MDATLRQRRGLLTIEAEIVGDGVRYRERALFRSSEFKADFTEIDPDPVRIYHVPRLSLIICIFFAMSFLLRAYRVLIARDVPPITLLWAALLLVLPVLGTWMYGARYVGFRTGSGGLLFFEGRGSRSPDAFLDRIREARREFLRANFPHLAADGPEAKPRMRAVGFTARLEPGPDDRRPTGTT